MRCQKCGAEVNKDVGVCFKCGTIVKEEINTENKKTTKKNKLNILMVIFIILGLICMIVSFTSRDFLSGIIAIIMTSLFAVSFLMGKEIIKEKRKGIRVLSATVAFVLIIPYFGTYDADRGKIKNFDWADIVMGDLLPEPEKTKGIINLNTTENLSMEICKITNKQYYSYVENCKGYGYTIDQQEDSLSFEAFNKNGYKLDLYFYETEEKMSIELDEPMEVTGIIWPDSDIAKSLPVPKSTVGNISWEDSDGFMIYVAETPKSEYNEYVKLCSESGFNIDYQKGDNYYYADNKAGLHLSLNYEGFNIINIHLSRNVDETTTEQSTTKVIKLDLEASSDEISVEVGSTLSSETFSQWESIENYESLLFVSEDESIARIQFNSIENGNTLCVSIEGVGIGETFVYVESENGVLQSDKIRVIVEELETEPETEEPTYSYYEEEEPVGSGVTVYVTPYGKKYHYSSACAGDNAMARDLDDVQYSYDPCKKCTY